MKKYHSVSSDNIFDESLVRIDNNEVYTTSLDVARVFNKRHDNVKSKCWDIISKQGNIKNININIY